MSEQGAKFTFIKKVEVSDSVEKGSADKPVDEKPKPKVSDNDSVSKKNHPPASGGGDKESGSNFASVAMSTALGFVRQTINETMSRVSGSASLTTQLKAAAGGLADGITLGAMAFTSPVSAIATVVSMAISYGFAQADFNRSKAWSDYDLSEYRETLGASAYNRSRK